MLRFHVVRRHHRLYKRWKQSPGLTSEANADKPAFSKLFPNEFMVSISNFKSPSIQYNVQFVNYGLIQRKIDDKAGYVSEWNYIVIHWLLVMSDFKKAGDIRHISNFKTVDHNRFMVASCGCHPSMCCIWFRLTLFCPFTIYHFCLKSSQKHSDEVTFHLGRWQ